MFVDKVTKECLGEIAFTMDVNVAPSPRYALPFDLIVQTLICEFFSLQPHVQDLVNAVIDKGLDFDCRTGTKATDVQNGSTQLFVSPAPDMLSTLIKSTYGFVANFVPPLTW